MSIRLVCIAPENLQLIESAWSEPSKCALQMRQRPRKIDFSGRRILNDAETRRNLLAKPAALKERGRFIESADGSYCKSMWSISACR